MAARITMSEVNNDKNFTASTTEKTFERMDSERSSDAKETSEANETNAVKTINPLPLSAVQSIKEKLAQLERLHTQHYGSYSGMLTAGIPCTKQHVHAKIHFWFSRIMCSKM